MAAKTGENAVGATASALPDHKYSLGMAPIEFTRQQYLGSESVITRFARTLLNKNELAGLELGRTDVILMWWLNVRKVFPRGDPMREEIMDQAGYLTNLGDPNS